MPLPFQAVFEGSEHSFRLHQSLHCMPYNWHSVNAEFSPLAELSPYKEQIKACQLYYYFELIENCVA